MIYQQSPLTNNNNNAVRHQVELETQKANKTIATLQASSDMRTAVHGQLQIDLELIAAKECLGRLADRKDAIAQRRFSAAVLFL